MSGSQQPEAQQGHWMTDVKTNSSYAATRVHSEGQSGSFVPCDICNACVLYVCITFVFISRMNYSDGVFVLSICLN